MIANEEAPEDTNIKEPKKRKTNQESTINNEKKVVVNQDQVQEWNPNITTKLGREFHSIFLESFLVFQIKLRQWAMKNLSKMNCETVRNYINENFVTLTKIQNEKPICT